VNAQEAFKTLLEELDDALAAVQEESAAALAKSDFSAVKDAADHGETIQQQMEVLEKLQREWPTLVASSSVAGKRAPVGASTPQEAFRIPILKALTEMGGQGATSDVLDQVGEMMEGQLNEIDRQMLPSGTSVRWRNKAQWARNALVNEGLMASDSPRGVWEITEEGRELLHERHSA
jgi:hypothetical protein